MHNVGAANGPLSKEPKGRFITPTVMAGFCFIMENLISKIKEELNKISHQITQFPDVTINIAACDFDYMTENLEKHTNIKLIAKNGIKQYNLFGHKVKRDIWLSAGVFTITCTIKGNL